MTKSSNKYAMQNNVSYDNFESDYLSLTYDFRLNIPTSIVKDNSMCNKCGQKNNENKIVIYSINGIDVYIAPFCEKLEKIFKDSPYNHHVYKINSDNRVRISHDVLCKMFKVDRILSHSRFIIFRNGMQHYKIEYSARN